MHNVVPATLIQASMDLLQDGFKTSQNMDDHSIGRSLLLATTSIEKDGARRPASLLVCLIDFGLTTTKSFAELLSQRKNRDVLFCECRRLFQIYMLISSLAFTRCDDQGQCSKPV